MIRVRFPERLAGKTLAAVVLAVIAMAGAGPAQALSDQVVSSALATDPTLVRHLRAAAKIVPASRPLQCVPFARKASGIQIRGDAWTWWRAAKGRYARGQAPEVGAVLVMKKTRRLRRGHLAVVTQIINSRTILVDQSNWLNRGRLHLNTAVLDVSRKNDWSAVRVWYTPGGRYGSRTYAAHGFVYPSHPAVRTAAFETMPLPRRRPDGRHLADLAYAGTTGIERLGSGTREAAQAAHKTRAGSNLTVATRIIEHLDLRGR